MKSGKDLGGLGGSQIEEATPDFGGWETAGNKTRDNTEIVRATFEGSPQVRISRFRGTGDGAGGEDDFVANDVRADQAKAR